MWGMSSPCAGRGGGVRLGLPGAELGMEIGIWEQRRSPHEGLKPQPPNYCFVFPFCIPYHYCQPNYESQFYH